jgi:hypothetical protein
MARHPQQSLAGLGVAGCKPHGRAAKLQKIMSTYRLHHLFAPRSVALIGASRREGSLGRIILENLREGGFEGAIHLVNPRYNERRNRLRCED